MPALERTGIIGFRWHDLRHTFASRLVMEGVPLKTVANYLGHASTQMVDRVYAHLAPTHVDTAILALDARRARRNEIVNYGTEVATTLEDDVSDVRENEGKHPISWSFFLPRQEGFEPPTHGLEGRCSIP